MTDVKVTISNDVKNKALKQADQYRPQFDGNDKKKVETGIEAILRDKQVKHAMVMLADA